METEKQLDKSTVEVQGQGQPQPFPTLRFDPEVPTVTLEGEEGLWVKTSEDGDRSVFIRKEAWDQSQKKGSHGHDKNPLGPSCVHGEQYGNDKDRNWFQPISVFDELKARYAVNLFWARQKCKMARWIIGKDRMAKIMLHAYL